MGVRKRLKTFSTFPALCFLSLMLACAGMWAAVPAKASQQDDIDALKAQVRTLMQKIDKMEKQQAAAPASSNMKAYWKNGFRIEYKDNKTGNEYKFRFRTGIQFRYTYLNRDKDLSGGNENYSSFNMRRLRFFVDGTAPNKDWKYFVHVQLEPKSKVNVHDAFIIWKKYRFARVQFGRMKIPGLGMEFWQSGFKQNGTDRTIFTDDGEKYWPAAGTQNLTVGSHLQPNGFPTGGMLNYRSQGILLNGYLDMVGRKQFMCYWLGVFNGRDTQGNRDINSDDKLYSLRVGFNLLPGSDPSGPMGPRTFNNYTMQGDMGYNTTPALALVLSSFWDKDRRKTYYKADLDPDSTYSPPNTLAHDVQNYGFDTTILFRYMGFSTDLEWAREEFHQDPNNSVGIEQLWDRWAMRANLGYFFVPKKWEAVFKYAYFERIDGNTAADSVRSHLGLVEWADGKYGVENYLQQYVLGVNHYFHGFNQYITFDVSLLQRDIKAADAGDAAAVGLTSADFKSGTQNDWRLRVMYQHFF